MLQAQQEAVIGLLAEHGRFVAACAFTVGDAVQVSGLVGASQYNGCGAQVSGFSAAKGRVVVKLEFDGELKMLEIKPQNLIAQSDA